MAEYEDAGNYGDPGDSGLEVPPAPWQYGSDDGDEGSGGGSSGFGGNADTDSSGSGGSSGFGDVGDTGGYSQGAGWDLMRQKYNDAGIGAGGTRPASGYPGMDWGLPPDNAGMGAGGAQTYSGYPGMDWGLPLDNAGINFPIDYSPPPGMGTDTDMGNPYEPIAPGTFDSPGVTAPPKHGGGGGGGRSYPSGPTIPPDVLRQFIDLLRYGGTLRI